MGRRTRCSAKLKFIPSMYWYMCECLMICDSSTMTLPIHWRDPLENGNHDRPNPANWSASPLLQNALDRIDWDHATQLDCYESQRYPVWYVCLWVKRHHTALYLLLHVVGQYQWLVDWYVRSICNQNGEYLLFPCLIYMYTSLIIWLM